MRFRSLQRGFLAAGVALGSVLPAELGARTDGEEQLEEVRRAVQERRERVAGYERQERGLLETLESMDRVAERLTREVRDARQALEAAQLRLVHLETEALRLERSQVRTRKALGERAVALYKAGQLGPVQVLFSAPSLTDFLSRIRVLRQLVDHDARLLERFRNGKRALVAAREKARRTARERDRESARAASRSRALGSERAARRSLLEHVHQDRARERAALIEFEAASLALEETVDTLRIGPRRGREARPGSFLASRGRLPWPAEGQLERGFGRVVDAQFQTETLHNGIDIEAREGAPVVAVTAGSVRFAGWFRGYGKLVILDHGDDYFTVSGHLSEIDVDVGDWVKQGRALGAVGQTGTLTGPGLYFEIRRGGQALDPLLWLESAPKR